jgi:allantoin racemase
MSKILYVMPGTGATLDEIARREKIANSFLINKNNKVKVVDTDEGPESIESSIEGDLSVRGVLRKLIEEKGSYDAVIIGCGDDPGLFSVRELMDVPVIGPMETSIAYSSMLGDKFGYITISEESLPETRMIFRKYGVENKCASIRSMNVTVDEMINNKISEKDFLDTFVREVKAAVKCGASTILLGCMSMAYMLIDEKVKDIIDIPIINPAKVAVCTAEIMTSLGLKHSIYAYPKPNLEKLKSTVLPELKTN